MVTKAQVQKILRTCDDPELGVNVVDLGLIYDIQISKKGFVKVIMTLTTPGCPLLDYFVDTTASKIRGLKGVKDAKVEITFDPPWDKSKMTKIAKDQLGLD
ncbi:metal-sulfur cluster assembly factor [Candidatus Parcubacteria bacterium]|jgi:metal-sulfur cluster biosynthetic enzyme|nr:MAG: metal-sulfur cluster assembly factor [Candidatus Parcubacteria bacterium]